MSNDKMTTVLDRVNFVFKEFGGTIAEFASLLGSSRSTIQRVLQGQQPVSVDLIRNICQKLSYSPSWLLMGDDAEPRESSETLKDGQSESVQFEIKLINARLDYLTRKIKVYDKFFKIADAAESDAINSVKGQVDEMKEMVDDLKAGNAKRTG